MQNGNIEYYYMLQVFRFAKLFFFTMHIYDHLQFHKNGLGLWEKDLDKLHHWLVMKFPTFDVELTNLFIILKIKLNFILYHFIHAICVCVYR